MPINHFVICTNIRPPESTLPSCRPNGGGDVYRAFVNEIARLGNPPELKVTPSGCLTLCQIGPNIIVYPAYIWYCHVKAEDVPEIIAAHLEGKTVERLLKPDDVRVI